MMKSIGDLVRSRVATQKPSQKLLKQGVKYDSLTLVRQVWHEVVPKNLRQMAQPEGLSKGVLTIASAQQMVSAELRYYQAQLIETANARLQEYGAYRDRIQKLSFKFSKDVDVRPESVSPLAGHPFFSLGKRECPRCKGQVPSGEIDRWGRCATCEANWIGAKLG
jgi:predicted nucleic acid-binding Zn ribbon protein